MTFNSFKHYLYIGYGISKAYCWGIHEHDDGTG